MDSILEQLPLGLADGVEQAQDLRATVTLVLWVFRSVPTKLLGFSYYSLIYLYP